MMWLLDDRGRRYVKYGLGVLLVLSLVAGVGGVFYLLHRPVDAGPASAHVSLGDVPTPQLELDAGSRVEQYRPRDEWDTPPQVTIEYEDGVSDSWGITSPHADLARMDSALQASADPSPSPMADPIAQYLREQARLDSVQAARDSALVADLVGSDASGATPVDPALPRTSVPMHGAGHAPGDAGVPEAPPSPARRFLGLSGGRAGGPLPNSIRAVVDQSVVLKPDEYVKLRLMEPLRLDAVEVPRGSVVVAQGKLDGNRMRLVVERVERNGYIFGVSLSAFDLDGQEGIFVPLSDELHAAQSLGADLGQSVTTGFTFSSSARDQVISGVSKYIDKKLRQIRVHLKSGYRVFLVAGENGK